MEAFILGLSSRLGLPMDIGRVGRMVVDGLLPGLHDVEARGINVHWHHLLRLIPPLSVFSLLPWLGKYDPFHLISGK